MIRYLAIIVVLFMNDVEVKVIRNNTVTGLKYDPQELLIKLFNFNNTITPRQNSYGLIKFEGQQDDDNVQNFVAFEENSANPLPLKFQDDNDIPTRVEPESNQVNFQDDHDSLSINESNLVAFQDNNDLPSIPESNQVTFQDDSQDHQQKPLQKKRRRRRRPRAQRPPTGYPGPVNPGFQQYQGQVYPGVQSPGQFGLLQGNYGQQQGYGFPPYRPPRRRPAAPDALSSIITALTSIARYDDQQCVPRLLCEAAGGALGTPGWLQTVAGLQPLLTILSAYNGISASPLFVFGRAVFLGMTSKGNPTTCRYAYNTCPTDPEELVHYLNNHNGGFFRFFNAPQRPTGQQNLEQFYNQLSGQYGFFPPANQPPYNPGYPGLPGHGTQNYGLYRPQNNFPTQLNPNGLYGFSGVQNQLYSQNQQNYGYNYPHDQYQYGLYNTRYNNNIQGFNGNKIQKRIQNKPNSLTDSDNFDGNEKWTFPENQNHEDNYNDNSANSFSSNRNVFSFPGQTSNVNNIKEDDYMRGMKGFQFPDNQYYRPINAVQNYQTFATLTNNNNNAYGLYTYTTSSPYQNYQNFNNAQDINNNRYTHQNNNYNTNNDQTRTVYIVRGNGDPNHPEVIRLKPGENVSR